MVPTFTRSSIGQGGAQLYSGSIATATPQAFTVASPPLELNGFGVEPTQGLVRCTPAHIHQIWSRLRGYGASSTGSLTLHLLTSLDEPAPSGSTDTARLLGAACHQSPSFPAIGCPDASSGRCDGPTETVSHHLSIHLAPRGAQLAAKKADAVFKIALRNSAFSRLKRFNSADSSVVVPGCAPASTWVWRTHLRTVSAQPTPSSRATSLIAAHSDSC
jgi:hypothetical protein